MPNCKCSKSHLTTIEYWNVDMIFVEPEKLIWRCDKCGKAKKLSKNELEAATVMFNSGFFFGKKCVKTELRKLLETD